MTSIELAAKMDKWLKEKVELNMASYMDTANKEYLGASRAYAEVKIQIHKLSKEVSNGQ